MSRRGIRNFPLSVDAYEEEIMRRLADRINERAKQRFHEACDRAWRPPERGIVEVITDPTDQRGFAARKVGRA